MQQMYQLILSDKQLQGYFEFNLPEDAHNLEFELELEDNLRYKSYVVVTDPGKVVRLQRLVSHGELRYAISNDSMSTSVGGYPGPIQRGLWKLNFYCMYWDFKELSKNETVITIKIRSNINRSTPDVIGPVTWTDYSEEDNKLTLLRYDATKVLKDQRKWYDGDFHTHTRLSDGKAYVPEAMEIAAGMGLQFYVTTEHNVIHTGFVETDLLIIPGIEITTEFGHFNCFGIKELPERLEELLQHPEDEERTEEIIRSMLMFNKNRGYINSINHPFLYPWSWQFKDIPLELVDMVEIENDPTYENADRSNEMALKLLDSLWMDGHRIYGIGGSDAHNLPEERYEGADLPSIVGDPRTSVFAEELSAKSILENVKKGHMCVSRFISLEPSIVIQTDLEKGELYYLPGDRLPDSCLTTSYTLRYRIKLWKVTEPLICRLLVNGSSVEEQRIEINQPEVDFTYRGDPMPYVWIRMDLRNFKGEFIGYTNPVYAGQLISKCQSYNDILEFMR